MHPVDPSIRKPLRKPAGLAFCHPGLLWKEWHQYRFWFLLFFLAIMQEIIFSLFYPQIFDLHQQTASSLSLPVQTVKTILQNGSSFTENVLLVGVIMLAGIMLGRERDHSLSWLVSTAVSRRQILMAKWLLGSLIILCCMAVLTAGMMLISADYQSSIPISRLLFWSMRMTVLLLALFSLALLSACIFSSFFYSVVFTGFFLALPMALINIIIHSLSKYHLLSAMQTDRANQWLNSFNSLEFVYANNGINTGDSRLFWLSTLVWLALAALFLLLALRIFEQSPLQRKGELLLMGHSKEIGRMALALLLAPPWAFTLADTWQLFGLYFLLLAAAVYLGLGLLWNLMAVLRLGRNAV